MKCSTFKIPNVSMEDLDSFFTEGEYFYNGIYKSTKIYPNGLKAKGFSEHKIIDDNKFTVKFEIDTYDIKTNKMKYRGERIMEFTVDPDNKLYLTSHSYIDNKLVSFQKGYCVKFSKNNLVFFSKGGWHITPNHHNLIVLAIYKKDNKISLSWKNDDKRNMIEEIKLDDISKKTFQNNKPLLGLFVILTIYTSYKLFVTIKKKK